MPSFHSCSPTIYSLSKSQNKCNINWKKKKKEEQGWVETSQEDLQVKRHTGIFSWPTLPKSKISSVLYRQHKPIISILGVKKGGQRSSYSLIRLSLCLPFYPHPDFCTDPQALPSVILEPRTSISLPLKSESPIFSQGKTTVITWLYHIREKNLGSLTASSVDFQPILLF